MRRLQLLALQLYPLAFRRRYGAELRALVDESPPRPDTLVDLLSGALAAHVSPPQGLGAFVTVSERLRATVSGVLACWVAFAAAGFAFYKTTEHAPFATTGGTRFLLGGSHVVVEILAALAPLAVVVGALPLILTALGYARRDRRLRRLLSVPVAAVAVFLAVTAVFILVAHGSAHHATTAGHAAGIVWILTGCACGAVIVLASRRALFAVPVSRPRLGLALAWGTVVTAAMVAIALAVAAYALVLILGASRLADAPNGPPFMSQSTWLSLTIQLIVMAVTAALATTTTLRSWRALGPARLRRA